MKKFLFAVFCATASFSFAQKPLYLDDSKPLDERVQDALSRMTLEEKTRLCYAQSKFSSPGVPRLGIPEILMSDGPHGVRMEINWNNWGHANWTNDSVTAFPALTCLAATWNPELAMKYGKAVGEEARYRRKSILLGPGLNIFRTPLNGRNFEYMGEDPFLTSTMAVPYIQGLQSNGVACCVKHYALNNQEEFRGHIDVRVSDRALYEIYLPAFKAAVQKGQAWSIMGSYNKYNGIYATHHPRLINEILKGEWGFKGAVVTDWGAAHDTRQAVFNGLDIEMGSYTNGLTSEGRGYTYDDFYLGKPYYNMAKRGEVSDSIVNDKAARILRLIFQTSMNRNATFGSLNSPEHVSVAREIAQEGIVLLKNTQVSKNSKALLPLTDERLRQLGKQRPTILVVGENATRSLCAGGGSSELKPRDEVSVLRGINERYGDVAEIIYAQGYESGKARYEGADIIPQTLRDSLYNDAIEKARKADLIIYTGGMNKNHFEDCEGGDRLSYNMSYNQDKLIAELSSIQSNIVVVIVSGTAVAMPWLDKVPTLLQSWYLGSETGHALADVLSGDVVPSGKTIFSYAPSLFDYPSHMMGRIGYPGIQPSELPDRMKSFADGNPKSSELLKMNATTSNLSKSLLTLNTSSNTRTHNGKGNELQVYNEDILVGYRWFDTKKKPVVFPFGYGLSYTTFKFTKATASAKTIYKEEADGNNSAMLTFQVTVKNTGTVAGKETVQLYIGDDKSSVVRPAKELKAYKKVFLKPNEEKTVELTINIDDLKYFDETTHEWVAEAGTFKAYIGSSSRDIHHVIGFELK